MEVSFAAALLAGLLSFISPCVLPLVPAYISFMTGVSVDRLRTEKGAELGMAASLHSLFFVLGFSTVFIALGASASLIGQLLLSKMEILSKVGGGLIVLFGLHYIGLFKISYLNMEARFNLQEKPPGLWGAYLIGLAFAFGWTPCVGPILATILALAGGQDSIWQGVMLLMVYSLGLGIPFILAGMAINSFLGFFTRIRVHLHKIEIFSGVLLVIVGIMIFTGDFNRLAILLIEWFPALATLG
ncbi:MAG: sulfite exporter TauE/SafE family protein [Magnetococcales bacterium]|nr:sulfite exporter TauE/SafE family protein [Magnetococcales bacterium]